MPSRPACALVQDFVQTVKLLLAPHGLLLLAHQIRRSVSHSGACHISIGQICAACVCVAMQTGMSVTPCR